MSKMWSEKKVINNTINVLLFLLAINIFHYGQLLLPVICIIILVDNRFNFKVDNYFEFALLCLFAITFFLFSYDLGFYGVMGFCLPMAYYIGSNLRIKNEESIKNLIYIIAFGMAAHLVLNFLFEIRLFFPRWSYLFTKASHYDVWMLEKITDKQCFWLLGCEIDVDVKPIKVRTTVTSINMVMIISCLYYLYKYEKNTKIKVIGLLLFLVSLIYSFALGRRTTFILIAISLLLPFFLEIKNIFKNNNDIKKLLMFIVVFIVVLVLLTYTNAFGIVDKVMNLYIVRRFIVNGINTERLEILLKSIPLYFKYPWGGQQISSQVGTIVHDLWGDIYDYAGVIPYVLMIVYSLKLPRNLRNSINKSSKNIKTLLLTWTVVCSIMMFIEPIMSGASLFLICTIIIVTSISSIDKELFN